MAAPFVSELLGRRSGGSGLPNISDSNSKTSKAISEKLLELVGLPSPEFEQSDSPETQLERAVAAHLRGELRELAPAEHWDVRESDNPLTDFAQYQHLAELEAAVRRDASGTLRIVVGADYLLRTTVVGGSVVPRHCLEGV